ncbi:MAG: hypothetical protein M3Y71_07185 [Actinomycetota bacterium]|nr:hypothetical protein [Actinomycetota bacterium]
MMWGQDSWNASGSMMTGLAMIALAVVAVGLSVWVVRSRGGYGRHPRLAGGRWPTRPSAYAAAEQVLARRFAAGEIDEAQFDRARDALHRERPAGPVG